MMIHRVYMVIKAPSELALDDALAALSGKIEGADGDVCFCSVQDGYSGEFAEHGADPSSWDDDAATCDFCALLSTTDRCTPDCAGWFIDEAGKIRACQMCGLTSEEDEESSDDAAIHVNHLLRDAQHDSMVDGWAVFRSDERGYEIERDDEACILFSDDDAGALAIAKLGALTGKKVGPR